MHENRREQKASDRARLIGGLAFLAALFAAIFYYQGRSPVNSYRSSQMLKASRKLTNGLIASPEFIRFRDPDLAKTSSRLQRISGKTLVLNVKDADGVPSFDFKALEDYGLKVPSRAPRSFQDFIAKYGSTNYEFVLYFVVFKDRLFAERYPAEAVKNEDGSLFDDGYGKFIDPASEKYRSYFLGLIEEAAQVQGASEIMLDYIRLPEYPKKRYPYVRSVSQAQAAVEQIVKEASSITKNYRKRLSL